MAKIVSRKAWITLTQHELQSLIAESYSGNLGVFQIVDVKSKMEGHKIDSVTFCLRDMSSDLPRPDPTGDEDD